MKVRKKRILAISGSIKAKSTSQAILSFIKENYSDVFEVEIYAELGKLPHFNPELEGEHLPKVVASFRNKIELADGVLFCTPEYVFSLPGSLKNALEWNVSTTLFSHKSVAMIVAAASGEKAFDSLSLILRTLESILPDTSRLLIQGAKGKVEADGQIKNPELVEKMKYLTESFINSIKDKNRTPTKYRDTSS